MLRCDELPEVLRVPKVYIVKLMEYKEVYEKTFECPIEARTYFLKEKARIIANSLKPASLISLELYDFVEDHSTKFIVRDHFVTNVTYKKIEQLNRMDFLIVYKKYNKHRIPYKKLEKLMIEAEIANFNRKRP